MLQLYSTLQLAQGRILKTIATCFFLLQLLLFLEEKVTQYVIGYNELPFSSLSLVTFSPLPFYFSAIYDLLAKSKLGIEPCFLLYTKIAEFCLQQSKLQVSLSQDLS